MAPICDSGRRHGPKQLARCGMNILQAVAIDNSADSIVLMMTSSTRIIRAVTEPKKIYIKNVDLEDLLQQTRQHCHAVCNRLHTITGRSGAVRALRRRPMLAQDSAVPHQKSVSRFMAGNCCLCDCRWPKPVEQ